MQSPIEQIDAATEGTRARHSWDCKKAAITLGLHPNRVTVWWDTVERRLIDLYISQPGPTILMLSLLQAKAEVERARRKG